MLTAVSLIMISCKTEKKGCPGDNYYNGRNAKQNRQSSRQMDGRVF